MRTVYTYLLFTFSLLLLGHQLLQAQPDCDVVSERMLSYEGGDFSSGAVIEACEGGPDTLK
ncbi:MAG: hypothetical protein AAGA62_11220, partial [Bacteroidota bacterium]